VPTSLPPLKASVADLIALALQHRMQAERSACPAEQCELDRIADIYLVLATIDLPMSTLENIVVATNSGARQLSDAAE
jgi:hypothetical protein